MTSTTTTPAQDIRIAYRSRVESNLAPYQLGAMLATLSPAGDHHTNLCAIDAATLTRIGRALAGLAVKQCNQPFTSRDEKRRATLKAQATTLAAEYGLTIEANGDPRGYVLRLHGPGVIRNGWGDGFGVA